ncbi:hypothetical protein GCM10010124_39450 [Pilimelia terevasa]|uniref:Uncharacterized protein n=1 Tax=Pilimelia terevasa TaxID=53372 RepID=A0A8J3FLH1_9ACTN|nr:hypothetical protein GCM10010124_39450 [Pilimelia terevasa]
MPRALGLLTAVYGAYTLARPASLLRTCGYLPAGRRPGRAGLVLGRAVGVRDTLSGLAMLCAPAGAPLRAAVAARVACDVADTVGFGLTVPAARRAKVVAITTGWAAACGASRRFAGRHR